MATEQKPTEQQKESSSQKASPILDTSGGEMPNPKAPPHGPTAEEAAETFKNSEAASLDNVPESQGDLADQAEKEIENEIRSGIDRARRDRRH